jgi:hypothetical protein
METHPKNSSNEIRDLNDHEIEATAGAWHKEIKLPNLGMIIYGSDGGYGVRTTDGTRSVTSMHYT